MQDSPRRFHPEWGLIYSTTAEARLGHPGFILLCPQSTADEEHPLADVFGDEGEQFGLAKPGSKLDMLDMMLVAACSMRPPDVF